MCTGRVDLSFIFRAFRKHADGVIIGGCWPGECHYVTEGNFDALANMHLTRRFLELVGLSPERVRLEWISASEGSRFAEIMSDFVERVRALGPIGRGEGVGEPDLDLRLEAVSRLIPFMKLVERETLRVPTKSEDAYNDFFTSGAVTNLFDGVVKEKLAISQILLLLGKRPLTTGEISETLGLNPSEVSRHINNSTRQGLVRYDTELNCYALA